MVFMPPRHGKSELISRFFPAWFLGSYPNKRIILASYEQGFAASWGRKARDVIEEWGQPVFGVEINRRSSSASWWDLSGYAGGMVAAGMNAGVTGKGADVLIIDDPVKDGQEASSKLMRDRAADWYASTSYTRLEPQGAVVLTMTRWNEDDLAGRLLTEMKNGGEQWEIINLPAICEDPTLPIEQEMGRSLGDALWPKRFGVDRLDEIRRTVGPYWWAALYQQRPAPQGGSMFKRDQFVYFDVLPAAEEQDKLDEEYGEAYVIHKAGGDKRVAASKLRRFCTVDLAASVKTTADYTVVSTWGVTKEKELLLLDVQKQRIEGPDQVNLIKKVFLTWKPSYVAIERTAYQLVLVQQLRREGLPIRELVADKDKVARAMAAAVHLEGGMIAWPRLATWLYEWEQELELFPNAAHDDQVDTLSYAVAEIQKARGSWIIY